MGGGEKLTGACGNGILGRHLRNGEHGRDEKLTASPTAVVAASGRASKTLVDGDGGWREKHGAGEVESGQIKAKKGNLRHLRPRGSTAKLQETLASWIGHRSGEFTGGSGELRARSVKGQRRGLGSVFISG